MSANWGDAASFYIPTWLQTRGRGHPPNNKNSSKLLFLPCYSLVLKKKNAAHHACKTSQFDTDAAGLQVPPPLIAECQLV